MKNSAVKPGAGDLPANAADASANGAPIPANAPANVFAAASFEALGTDPFFVRRLLERGIRTPTEIQRRVIPRILAGENVLFRAPTGTGKTFAYLVPLFRRFLCEAPEREGPRILVCAPTHELCSQIKGEADFLLAGLSEHLCLTEGSGQTESARPLRASLVIGSANMGRQIDALKKERPTVIVGNPGRLLQLARMKKLRLAGVRALVLDEGDRLVADEIREETEALLRFLPAERQGAACSATVSAKSRERLMPLLSPASGGELGGGELTGRCVLVETEGALPPGAIEHWAFFAEDRKKISLLRSLLTAAKPRKALVFTGRPGQAGNIVSQLQYRHLAAGGIWGDMDKRARKAAMDGFRRGHLSILVASDLACRGLDIEGVSHVIALDVPADGEWYLHRAGRTGRAGKRGIMATIGNEEEMRRLERIEKKLGITVYPKALYGGRILAPQGDV